MICKYMIRIEDVFGIEGLCDSPESIPKRYEITADNYDLCINDNTACVFFPKDEFVPNPA